MIAVLADIHGNYPALQAVVSAMPEVSEVWILGDTLGELPFPLETLALLDQIKEKTVLRMIAGNREVSLLEAYRGEHPDWWAGTQFRAIAWTVDQLDSRQWEEMAQLRTSIEADTLPGGAVLCHGTPSHVRGMVRTRKQAELEIETLQQGWLACGHTHNARLFCFENKTVINAGSVGISLDGIGGMASYALLDETAEAGKTLQAEIRYVAYDIEQTFQGIKERGLQQLAPGIMRALQLELQTGRHHMKSLVFYCKAYAEQYLGYPVEIIPAELWNEAEQAWDGSEWLPARMEA